jgi:phosphoglycerate dehydrogenase-like enzyme
MSKLLIIAPEAEACRSYIAQRAPDLEIEVASSDKASTRELMRQAEIPLAWRVPPDLLKDAPRLRWIQSFGAGVDHLINAGIAPDVVITRIVDAFGPAMAEYVLGYCLATRLKVRRVLDQQRQAQWKPFNAELLRGSTAVVVGLGNIGREICRLLGAADVRVLGVSRSGQLVPEAERTFVVEELDSALPQADFLVLVLPLTPATRGLIGRRQLGFLPSGAWLINVARGPIVVEADLLAALRSGALGGAVLDVFEQEPLPPEHPFWEMENVIVTPHLAGPDDIRIVAEKFVENYRRLRAGQPLLGVVDRGRGY